MHIVICSCVFNGVSDRNIQLMRAKEHDRLVHCLYSLTMTWMMKLLFILGKGSELKIDVFHTFRVLKIC